MHFTTELCRKLYQYLKKLKEEKKVKEKKKKMEKKKMKVKEKEKNQMMKSF